MEGHHYFILLRSAILAVGLTGARLLWYHGTTSERRVAWIRQRTDLVVGIVILILLADLTMAVVSNH